MTRWQTIKFDTMIAALAAPSALAWGALGLGGSVFVVIPILCTGRLIGTLPSEAELSYVFSWLSPYQLMSSWVTMVIAMMLPLAKGPLSHVRKRSLARNVVLTSSLFVLGYLGLWMLAGVAFVATAVGLRITVPSGPGLFLAALFATLLWQASPVKQVTLNATHSHPPLSNFGRAARAGLNFGILHAAWCVASCGPIMFTALLVPTHSILWMALAAMYIWAERVEAPQKPRVGLYIPKRAFRALRYRAKSALAFCCKNDLKRGVFHD